MPGSSTTAMSISAGVLLLAQVGQTVFAVQRNQLVGIERIAERNGQAAAVFERQDERGQPMQLFRLVDVFWPGASSESAAPADSQLHGHLLLVPTRRRTVALLAERVDALDLGGTLAESIAPVPPLLAQHGLATWYSGVLVWQEQPVLVLNLRQIAQHALKQQR